MIAQPIPSTESRRRLPMWITTDGLAVVGLLLMTILLWLPYGFAVPFWADGWGMMGIADRGVVVENSVRPFVYIPYAIAHILSSNLFTGLNLVLAASMFGKALFLYLLLKRLASHKALSFAAAALLLIFPADTSIFNEGTLSIHFAVFCTLAAVYFLIAYWQEKRWYFLALMGLTLVISLGIYEAVYPLVLFTPLLLLWQEKRFSRRVVIVSLLWYALPLIVVVRLVLISSNNPSEIAYQSGLFRGLIVQDMLSNFLNVYRIQFIGGWRRYSGNVHPRYVLIIVLACAGIIVWLSRKSVRLAARTLLLLTLGGLAIIALGYAPYFLTLLRDSTDRTLFYSSVGGAITLTAVLMLITQVLPLKRLIFVGGIAGLVALGTLQMFVQHQQYDDAGSKELPALRSILALTPLIQSNTLVLVIDETPDRAFGSTFVYASIYFETSLQLVTENPGLMGAVCYPHDQTEWGTLKERCYLQADRVQIVLHGVVFREQPYSRVVAFRYHADHTLTLESSLAPDAPNAPGYDPFKLIDTAAQLPPRFFSMLGGLTENSP